MIRSMTAFGRAVGESGGKRYTVELRSVNNRYLDITVKLPRLYGYLEEPLKAALSARGVSRGKVEIFVSIETLSDDGAVVALDEALTSAYLKALARLRDEYGLRDDISVMTVAQNRDLFRVTHPETDEDAELASLMPIFLQALDAFCRAREEEGGRIAKDLIEKTENLARMREQILARSEKSLQEYRKRLEGRLRQILSDMVVAPDEARILTECAIFADKIAVDEEMVRLASHFEAMHQALSSSEAVGRRLDFLVQEMNREVNTTGSKSADSTIAALVIEAKCELEKIREQIQNIE